jgi:nitronate monooxygenase
MQMPHEQFTARFGLRCPIVQAPTGSIAGPELAAAVAEAGGMGAMALTWADPNAATAHVRAVLAATSRPFLVNYALAHPPRSLEAALEAGAPVVTFSWGDPSNYVHIVRASGARLGIQVTNAEGARRAVQHAPDFLICQGTEAGGHVQATRPLTAVLAEVMPVSEGIPVVASGGIGDGLAMAAALRAGASAVMLGTRFVATLESRAHPEYKRLLVQHDADDTSLTVCFDGGWPYAAHRVLRNSTLEAWEAAGCPPVGLRPGEGDTVGSSADGSPILRYEDTAPRTGFAGDIASMCCYSGTSCSAIDDIPSARDLVPRLWAECTRVLASP